MTSVKSYLSKSTFLRGWQCPKALFLHRYRKDLVPQEASTSQEAVFKRGQDIGKLAQQIFPGGIDCAPENYYDVDKACAKTQRMIAQGNPVIYEAYFNYEGCMCAIDILVNRKGKWYAYEVKSSGSVKDVFLLDTAYQYWVITNIGLPLAGISVIHLNLEYELDGDLDVHGLFSIVSVRKEVKAMQKEISAKVKELHQVLDDKDNEPSTDIGPHCSDPYPCDFIEHCWSHIPDYSVFDISRIGKKAWELNAMGVQHIEKIPADFQLTTNQSFEVEHHKTGMEYVDRKALKKFVSKLKFPLHYLDFETIMPAVPVWHGTRPYQQLPFQFSLHTQREQGGEVEHKEFLVPPHSDPRKRLLESLLSEVENKGDVLVYNASFESSRLRELAEEFPEHRKGVNRLIKRLQDLIVPFRKRWYYSSKFRGSASIKDVLPVLIPELSYKELEIGDGGTASIAYESLIYDHDADKTKRILQHLSDYCKLDTLAMVRILEKLYSYI